MRPAEAQRGAAAADAPAQGRPQPAEARISALTVEPDPQGSLEEAIFRTVRETLDRARLETRDIDAVVIAADDVSDGRSITTMMHATAAGAYLKDEIRVTGGSLTALAVARSRIASGLSERVLVVVWWRPTANTDSIGRSTLDPVAAGATAPDQVTFAASSEAVASCVVSRGDQQATLAIDGWALVQADYLEWLAQTSEPQHSIERLGELLLEKRDDLGDAALLAARAGEGDPSPWVGLQQRLGARELVSDSSYYGVVDGVARAAIAQSLPSGSRAVVAATGLPPFLRTEAITVRRL